MMGDVLPFEKTPKRKVKEALEDLCTDEVMIFLAFGFLFFDGSMMEPLVAKALDIYVNRTLRKHGIEPKDPPPRT